MKTGKGWKENPDGFGSYSQRIQFRESSILVTLLFFHTKWWGTVTSCV